VSRYMQLAIQVFGKPTIDLVGDGSVYPNWRNVTRPLIEFWTTQRSVTASPTPSSRCSTTST